MTNEPNYIHRFKRSLGGGNHGTITAGVHEAEPERPGAKLVAAINRSFARYKREGEGEQHHVDTKTAADDLRAIADRLERGG